MNVTKENFKEVAEQIEALLPTAAFVSFDEEMTGISVPGLVDKMEDTPAQRYGKMRQVASRYGIIQFGLAIFHQKPCEGEQLPGSERYEARAFNFYVFPATGPMNMDASGVHFNSQHGMDWNCWIRQGIPYLTREAAQKLRESILPKAAVEPTEKKETPKRMVLSKDSDIKLTGEAIESLKSWLADEARKDETEFEVIETNAYLRRFMHETFAADFSDLIVESRPTAKRGMSKMVVMRLTEEQKAERQKKVQADKEADVEQKVGFRRVFDALVKAKKPIVGHAVMYDTLFALSKFEGPLPEVYADFKVLVKDLFPVMFDTQILVRTEPFKFLPQVGDEPKQPRFGSVALGAIHQVLKDEVEASKSAGKPTVEVSLAEGHERYGAKGTYHEAGYDAFATGYVFAQLKRDLSPEVEAVVVGRSTMWRSLYNFNLAGEDELTAKGTYVHVSGLKGLDDKPLRAAFASLEGVQSSAIEVRWLDDDNAFAVLPEAAAEAAAALIEKPAEGKLKLGSWSSWVAAHSEADADVAEPPAKRAKTAA